MSPSPSRVLFVSSESRPFASTGGLSDVSGALPDALNRSGWAVDRVLPLYRRVREGEARGDYRLEATPHVLSIPMGHEIVEAEVFETVFEGTPTYFINHEEYFDRTELYALPHREYRDNFTRFVFFQKAVVALLDALGHVHDFLHLNDWQTGLIPLFLEKGIQGTGRERRERTLLTIHNLAYQGVYSARHLFETNLPGNLLDAYPSLEYYGKINMLKAGIIGADRVNTVSPTYAREILTPEFGCGLEGVLNALPHPVAGVVNGVDTRLWDPETDTRLIAGYSANSLRGKESCKKELLREFGLSYERDQPLFVMISRLVEQKGFDLLAETIEPLMSLPVRMIVLGSGQESYQNAAREWAEKWPDRFAAHIGFDADLSHRIEAGGDFFLMPSRFEPCGLNQLYSLRYGTLPIVNATGGLKDTVTDLRSSPREGTGYLMNAYTPEAFLDCVREAVSLYHEKTTLRAARQRGMRKDVSWDPTARAYRELYGEILADPS